MRKIAFVIIALMFLTLNTTFGQKYAYVDTEYILDNIPEYKDAQTELDQLSKQWQKEIEQKFKEIDNLYKNFQAESVLLPEEVKKKREAEIINAEKEAKELQKKRFGKDGDLFKKRQELVKPLQDKIYNAIEKRAQDKSYIFIFDKAGSLTIMYADPKYDISDEILDDMGYKLNKTKTSTTSPGGQQKTANPATNNKRDTESRPEPKK